MSDADSPLLGGSYDESSGTSQSPDKKSAPLSWPTVVALIVTVACASTAVRIVDLPLTRLIESRYCSRYYAEHDPSVIAPDGSVSEALCKIDAVQQQLAWLLGSIVTMHVLADMVVTLPLASVSDKYGRRSVFVLNLTGLLLMGLTFLVVGFFELPIELSLIAPVFTLIGGGDCVFLTVLVTTMSDITTDMVVRTRLFSYIASVVYVSTVLSPLIAASIMSLNILVPFLLAGSLLSIALLTTRLLPGRHYSTSDKAATGEDASLIPELSTSTSPLPSVVSSPHATESKHSLLRGIAKRPKFRLLLGVFFLASFASSSSQLLVQYISKRYGWTIAQAGLLLSAKAVVNVLLLTVLVPLFVGLATRRLTAGPTKINIGAAEICVAISVAGVLWIALSTKIQILIAGLIVYALGSALPVFTELLVRAPEISGYHGASSNAQDFSIATLSKTFGTLLGTPAMTAIWAAGIHFDNAPLGLPFYTSTVAYAIASVLLLRLRIG